MRIIHLSIAVPLLMASAIALTGCATAEKETEAKETRRTVDQPMTERQARSFERDLEAVKPRLAKTMAALDNVMAHAESPNLPAAKTGFMAELTALRTAAGRVIADLDEQRRQSDAFFLDRDRTDANTGQPGVLEGRERVGFVGEYIIQLRRDYFKLMDDFNGIEAALAGDKIDMERARPHIQSAQRNRINVDNDISVLLGEMRRVNFAD